VEYQPPAYVNPAAFSEKDVLVGTGDKALPGTLTMPMGNGPFPAVVLVHGSGPNDRDETIGPNKPFRDLAWGLASQGIAVLRYEKRTKVHPEQFTANSTVKEETIDDAIAAVSLLRQTAQIDSQKVYVLGHSLGGMLIPRIGTMIDPNVAGFIILAGNTRPLEDLLIEQITYIVSVDGKISGEEQAQIDIIKQQVANIKNPQLSSAVPASELPFGIPAAYWLDLRDYRPAAIAQTLQQPMLILQGERDYQVTMVDFQGWQQALASRQNVVFKSYSDLNHLFMEGSGKSTPGEYLMAGHVSETVINDIANWIKN
jgi:dienelactone hydrolase